MNLNQLSMHNKNHNKLVAKLVLTMSSGYYKYLEVFEDYKRYFTKECGSSSQYLNSQYSDKKLL